MTRRERLLDDLKSAMKAQDARRLNVLRMIKARILEAEVAQRASKGRDFQLPDEDVLRVVAAYAKQRREAIDSFRAGGRADLAANEEAELQIVEGYLPAALSEDQVRAAVQEAIAACGATSARDIGAVMKTALAKLAGAADGKVVNRIARELLGAGC
jgi:uncharacterized protein YqeY